MQGYFFPKKNGKKELPLLQKEQDASYRNTSSEKKENRAVTLKKISLPNCFAKKITNPSKKMKKGCSILRALHRIRNSRILLSVESQERAKGIQMG